MLLRVHRRLKLWTMPPEMILTGTTSGHSAIPILLFADGPGAERFKGMMENSEIPVRLVELTGIKSLSE